MKKILVIGTLLLSTSIASAASDNIVLKVGGKPVVIQRPYWIDGSCVSKLNKIVRAELSSGSDLVSLSVSNGQQVKTQQCGNTVTGGYVFATAKKGPARNGQIAYTVEYKLVDGTTTYSTGSATVSIVP